MNLGILCTMINGFGRRGFYNTQEIGLGRALVKLGHTVTIYKAFKSEGKTSKYEKKQIQDGLTILYMPLRGIGAHGYLPVSVLDKTLDGLLCFTDNQIFIPHIYKFCQKHQICFVPYVGTAHSLHSGVHARLMDAWFKSGTLKVLKRSVVIAKTTGAKDELAALGVYNATVAPVGLDVDELHHSYHDANIAALKAKYGFERDDVVICNVSRLEPEKRPLELIDMFQKVCEVKKCKLLLVGEGPLKEALDEKIKAAHLENDVKCLSRIPYADMWELYTISDYFVNMNKGEIFGMAIMEAVYYETCVVAHNAPGPSITLKDMPGHHLCTDDEEMIYWLKAPASDKSDLQASSNRMVRDFSWATCAKAFENIVQGSRYVQ